MRKLSKEELDAIINWEPKVGDIIPCKDYDRNLTDITIEEDDELGSISIQNLLKSDLYIYRKRFYRPTHYNGLLYEIVADNSIYNDGGKTEIIVRFDHPEGELFVRFNGWYSSWDNCEYADSYKQVFPYTEIREIQYWGEEEKGNGKFLDN